MAEPARLVLATRSAGKLPELIALCASHGIAAESAAAAGLAEDPAEAGIEVHDTFAANAEAKARWFAARLGGRVVLADDSGLEVAALGGAPGVHSKRWSGTALHGQALDDANNARLAAELVDVADRRARYRCVVVATDGTHVWRGDGRVEGRIATAPEGRGGFGYDPWFISDELGVTFGVAAPEEKARVSHRARAVAACLASAGDALRCAVRHVPRL
ncbi:MAG: non-canonical purine NTP pyrophosphatase [Gemmatimonadaceae bacterium]